MKTNVIDISPPFSYLRKSRVMGQNQIAGFFKISREKGMMKFIFDMQINIKGDTISLGVHSQACPK